MNLKDYNTSKRYEAMVAMNTRISPSTAPGKEVHELQFDIHDEEFNVAVGQNIGVLAPGRKELGQDHHFRLYSIAGIPEKRDRGHRRFPICVRRCTYIDEYSGEEFKGIASNYLCDRHVGDKVTIAGPYGPPFEAPDDPDAALILIGAGTGIAPFRGFVKHLYRDESDFKGRVILFHGGHTGLDLLYMNEDYNDFAQYYDRETFHAIEALSQRPHWSEEIDWSSAIESRGEEIWQLLTTNPHTRVYVAGLANIRDALDAVFAKLAGSEEKWATRKAELAAGERWHELLY